MLQCFHIYERKKEYVMKKALLFTLSLSMFGTSTGSVFAQEVYNVAKPLETTGLLHAKVNRNENETITARSFAIAVSDVNAENLIRYAGVQAYDMSSSSPQKLTDIIVSLEGAESSTSSKLPEKAGVYYITFSTSSGQAATTVTAYVYAGIDSAYTEAIEAVDFAIELRDVTEENIILYSRALTDDITPLVDAEGWDYPDYIMDEVKVASALPTTTGVHDVTLVSASGKTTATVKAYVYHAINSVGRYQEAVNANDLTIALRDVTVENLRSYAAAKGYDVSVLDDDYTSVPPTELAEMTVISALPTTTGVHDVTFATPSGMTTITVQVTVV